MAEQLIVKDFTLFMEKHFNTMKHIFTLILVGITALAAQAQVPFKQNHNFGLALSAGSQEFNAALSWNQTHGIFKNNKFKLGYGIRYNFYTGSDKLYTTAPAELTSNMTGPGVLFSETFPENIDTFSVASAQHHSINAAIYLEYDFNEKWGVGFNIDAIGLSFGPEASGSIISSYAPDNFEQTEIKAKPTAANVLLISDNDIGMLNSELYVKYNLSNKLGFRAGFTFEFTEYTTEQEFDFNFNNDRFRYKSLMGMISINYKPFIK